MAVFKIITGENSSTEIVIGHLKDKVHLDNVEVGCVGYIMLVRRPNGRLYGRHFKWPLKWPKGEVSLLHNHVMEGDLVAALVVLGVIRHEDATCHMNARVAYHVARRMVCAADAVRSGCDKLGIKLNARQTKKIEEALKNG